MIATINYPGFKGSHRRPRVRKACIPRGVSLFLACFLGTFSWEVSLPGEPGNGASEIPGSFGLRAQKRFMEDQNQFQSQPGNPEMALKFGLAAFDWAEFATNSHQREAIALAGIDACRSVVAGQPKSAAGHYYLAMNLGQLARTKTLGALKLVDEMETEFQITRKLDEDFDYAGPDRNLGLLYSEAPGWPTSIGSRGKARHHLCRAVVLKPNYPENRLNLLEAYLKWGDKSGANQEFRTLKELWPTAKNEFTGELWEMSWTDWDRRWEKIQIKFPVDKVVESPRNQK